MFAWAPWELALVDEPLLVLFGVVPSPPNRLLANVVLWVFVDLLEACRSVFVHPDSDLDQGSFAMLLHSCHRCLKLSHRL